MRELSAARPVLSLLLLLDGLAPTTARAIPTVEVIALSGAAAPGTPEGVVFEGFSSPVINGPGQVAFSASLAGPGVSGRNATGLWGPGPDGSSQLIARRDDPAPSFVSAIGGPRPFGLGGPALLNDDGQAAFYSTVLSYPGLTEGLDQGVWTWDAANGLTTAMRTAAQAPGTPAGTEIDSLFNPPRFNSNGDVVDVAILSGPGIDTSNDRALYRSNAGGPLWLVEREGTAPIPGDILAIDLTDTGLLGFLSADLTNDALPDSIWVLDSDGNRIRTIAAGSAAPGPAGTSFARFSGPTLNETGAFVFTGIAAGPAITSENDNHVWRAGANGIVETIAREGDEAPGLEAGTRLTFLSQERRITGSGTVAFRSGLGGPDVTPDNDSSFWKSVPGEAPELLLREGDPAPGLEAGVTIGDLLALSAYSDGVGALARVRVTGDGVTTSNDRALYAARSPTEAILLLREGEVLALGPGDSRVVESFSYQGELPANLPSVLSASDQLAIQIAFTDGSEGVFAIATPEPGAGVLIGIGLPILLQLSSPSRRSHVRRAGRRSRSRRSTTYPGTRVLT